MNELIASAEDAWAQPLSTDDFEALDGILDDLRQRVDATPQWEYCEGFMVALLCCRRQIAPDEYLPLLLSGTEGELAFRDPAQQADFWQLWQRRWAEVRQALDAPVENLDDERCYHPELMDPRGAYLLLPEADRASFSLEELPSFGQVWALGFMDAVELWADEWTPPRDRRLAQELEGALAAIEALTASDTEPPEVAPFGEGPASVSGERVNQLADAIWAVYDLRAFWHELGPRIATVHAEPKPGRNDPCSCGSGKKYKKCCGA